MKIKEILEAVNMSPYKDTFKANIGPKKKIAKHRVEKLLSKVPSNK